MLVILWIPFCEQNVAQVNSSNIKTNKCWHDNINTKQGEAAEKVLQQALTATEKHRIKRENSISIMKKTPTV